jgi:peptidoglycan/LPS O-acetylase OafA/YrhL
MHEFMFFGGQWRKRLIRLVPILLTIVIIPLTMLMFVSADTSAPEAMGEIDDLTRSLTQDLSRLGYLATEMRVMVTYARLLIFPINQNFDYDYPLSHSFWEPRVIVSFVFLASILGLGVYMLRRSYGGGRIESFDGGRPAARPAAFGVFWFFLALSVESTLIPLLAINEHRMYLPSVGAFVALSAGALALYEKMGSRAARTALASFAAILVLVLSAASLERNTVWKSELALWEDVVRKSPRKARGHYNLGCRLQDMGLRDRAVDEYLAAISLDPANYRARVNLGILYTGIGELGLARMELEEALRFNPNDPQAMMFLRYVKKNIGPKGQ